MGFVDLVNANRKWGTEHCAHYYPWSAHHRQKFMILVQKCMDETFLLCLATDTPLSCPIELPSFSVLEHLKLRWFPRRENSHGHWWRAAETLSVKLILSLNLYSNTVAKG